MIERSSCNAIVMENPLICPECGASLDMRQEFFCSNCAQHFLEKTLHAHVVGMYRLLESHYIKKVDKKKE
jgi:predicted amidophosphoribosyltransferase